MKAESNLKGVVAACVTPVSKTHDIDTDRLKFHMETVLAAGCSYISEFGTTGEGASFSTRQKSEALKTLAGSGMDMKRHIPGVVSSSLDEAACMFRAIDEINARAALVIPPFYYEPSSPEAVVDFYDAMISRAGSPDTEIILYNFPHFSGVTFDEHLVQLMLDRLGDRVIGIKDSTGDLEAGLKLIRSFPELSIFTGDDRILPDMVAAGGAGMIGGMTNPYPADTVRLYTGPLTHELKKQAVARIDAVDASGGLPALKAMVADLYDDEGFRAPVPPLRPASEETMRALYERIHEALRE